MSSTSEGFLDYTAERDGRYVETANWKVLSVVGCGQLEIVAEQPGEAVTVSFRKVLYVPQLERNFIVEHPASLMFGLTVREKPHGGTPVNWKGCMLLFQLLAIVETA